MAVKESYKVGNTKYYFSHSFSNKEDATKYKKSSPYKRIIKRLYSKRFKKYEYVVYEESH